MLVLSRKLSEKILIGDDIEITVVGVVGETVRLGIAAPKEIKILRYEVYEEVRRQNLEAAAPATGLADLKGLLKDGRN